MNSLDNIEAMLRGFRPRRPSPKLKAALFGSLPQSRSPVPAAPAAPACPRLAATQAWFLPLSAAALLLLTLATAWSPFRLEASADLACAALAACGDSVEQNALPTPKFPSTNGGAVGPTFGSLLLRQTNVFAR